MKKQGSQSVPKARSGGLLIEELGDEILVYDLERHKAHCLNPVAARVWKRCDGHTRVKDIARGLGQKTPAAVDEQVVLLALDQLSKAHLLSERIKPASGKPGVSRRELIRKIGVAAALSLPAITTILTPTARAAVSCTPGAQGCTPSGMSCSSNLACCSCNCQGGTCQ